MKNSPHRINHLKNKALRSASHTDVKGNKQEEKNVRNSHKLPYMHVSHNGFRPFKDHLKPINTKIAKEMLDYIVAHWKREVVVHNKTAHGSKRTTPGEVENTAPFTKQPKNPNKMLRKLESSNLAKNRDTVRHFIKQHNRNRGK